MIRFLGNIEAKADTKEEYSYPLRSGNNFKLLPKRGLLCEKTCFKTA